MDKQKIKEIKKTYASLTFAIISRNYEKSIPKEYNIILDLIEEIEHIKKWNLDKEIIKNG